MLTTCNDCKHDLSVVACIRSFASCFNTDGSKQAFESEMVWKFMSAPSILLRMDADNGGWDANFQLKSQSLAAYKIQVPKGKDVNEFYVQSGQDALLDWITTCLESKG